MIVEIEEGGKKYRVVVPDNAKVDTYKYGIRVGPPDFSWLPPHIDVRLHNELYNRGLITVADVMSRPQEVQAALQAAVRVDVQTVIQTFKEYNGHA